MDYFGITVSKFGLPQALQATGTSQKASFAARLTLRPSDRDTGIKQTRSLHGPPISKAVVGTGYYTYDFRKNLVVGHKADVRVTTVIAICQRRDFSKLLKVLFRLCVTQTEYETSVSRG